MRVLLAALTLAAPLYSFAPNVAQAKDDAGGVGKLLGAECQMYSLTSSEARQIMWIQMSI